MPEKEKEQTMFYVALLSIVLGTGACMLLLLADSLYF